MQDDHFLNIGGRAVPLELRKSARARRLLLRVDQRREVVVLTLPERVSRREGLRFAEGNARWVADRLASLPPRIPFTADAVVPLLGRPHRLHHIPPGTTRRRGAAWVEGETINITGDPAHFPRRTLDFLRGRARAEIGQRAERFAGQTEKEIRGLVLRDPTSRWGSCSPRGELSFSWRLIMAPAFVLDYVVAHEVAHLSVFSHAPRFWTLVGQLVPRVDEARQWLRREGAGLHRYGPKP
ncbi:M48 family metallopeptidase [Zavarzinia compransoris]|uniref:M48 family metallopeptidase n=1 Tax=Zavarzinia marina TaxID=2911065 RepID=UPI001F18A008|nr:SprT family zinc-dependent metalloprotease [Zavarzinia marina]MCF4167435.1 M48 family metallopeptidase [Zavarzinia marina]